MTTISIENAEVSIVYPKLPDNVLAGYFTEVPENSAFNLMQRVKFISVPKNCRCYLANISDCTESSGVSAANTLKAKKIISFLKENIEQTGPAHMPTFNGWAMFGYETAVGTAYVLFMTTGATKLGYARARLYSIVAQVANFFAQCSDLKKNDEIRPSSPRFFENMVSFDPMTFKNLTPDEQVALDEGAIKRESIITYLCKLIETIPMPIEPTYESYMTKKILEAITTSVSVTDLEDLPYVAEYLSTVLAEREQKLVDNLVAKIKALPVEDQFKVKFVLQGHMSVEVLPKALAEFVTDSYKLTAKARNKLMHALNGNSCMCANPMETNPARMCDNCLYDYTNVFPLKTQVDYITNDMRNQFNEAEARFRKAVGDDSKHSGFDSAREHNNHMTQIFAEQRLHELLKNVELNYDPASHDEEMPDLESRRISDEVDKLVSYANQSSAASFANDDADSIMEIVRSMKASERRDACVNIMYDYIEDFVVVNVPNEQYQATVALTLPLDDLTDWNLTLRCDTERSFDVACLISETAFVMRHFGLVLSKEQRNKLQHALNGNINNKIQKELNEAKKDLNKAKKQTGKLPIKKPQFKRTKKQNPLRGLKNIKTKGMSQAMSSARFSPIKKMLKDKNASFEAMKIALPFGVRPMRWADNFASVLTSAVDPHYEEPAPINQTTTTSANDLLNPGDTMIFAFRSLLRNFIRYQYRTKGWRYNGYAQGTDGVAGATVLMNIEPDTENPLKTVYASDTRLNNIQGPHGSYWYAAKADEVGNRFFWLQANQNYYFDLTNASGSLKTVTVYWYVYKNGQLNLANVIPDENLPNGSTATFGFSVGEDGYHCVTIKGITNEQWFGSISNIRFYTQTDSHVSTWGHISSPYIMDYRSKEISEYRVTATACMISNTSAEAWKNGTAYGTQLPGKEFWYNFTDDPAQALQQYQDVYTGPASEGVYGFIKPTDAADFNYTREYEIDANGEVCDCYYDIRPSHDFLALYLTAPATDGRSCKFSYFVNSEYRTKVPLTQLGRPDLSVDEASKAIQEIIGLNNVTSNENHIKSVINHIKTYGRKAFDFVKENKTELMALGKLFATML